jgi:hypothetical protein
MSWTITFFEKGFDAGRSHGHVESEMVQVKRQDGSLVRIPGIGNDLHTWIASDGRQEDKLLPPDLASGRDLSLLFETFPSGGEAFQLIKWDGEEIEEVHYDDHEDVHVDA